jgi:hypothetical protein
MSFGQFIFIVVGTFVICTIWKKIDPSGYQRQKDAAKKRRKFAFGLAKRYAKGRKWL